MRSEVFPAKENTEEDAGTQVEAPRRPGISTARSRLGLFALLPALIAVDTVVCRNSEPQNPSGFAGLPAWTLVATISLAAVVALAVVALGRRLVGTAFCLSYTSALVVVMLAVARTTAVSIQAVPVPAPLQAAPSSSSTAQAQHAMRAARGDDTCAVIRQGSGGPLPTPFQRRAYPGGRQAQAGYFVNWNDDLATYGLVHERASAPNFGDTCQRSLGGGWWAVMGTNTTDEAQKGCPNGHAISGGGWESRPGSARSSATMA